MKSLPELVSFVKGLTSAAPNKNGYKYIQLRKQYSFHIVKIAKFHDMLRDVFFIDDPIVDEVPRRNERHRYYARGLVATAV